MKRWIGRWLIGISLFHTIVAGVLFGKDLVEVARRGTFHTIGSDPTAGAAIWFVLFGVLLFVYGLALDALEKASPHPLPKVIGWSLLVLGAAGGMIMPVSGFWLAFPPAIAILAGTPHRPASGAMS